MREQRGQRVRRAPRFAGNAGARDADLSFRFVVERLELLERDRPAAKIFAVHAEEIPAHVHGAAADAAGDPSLGAALERAPVARDQMWIARGIGNEPVAPADGQLVVEEVFPAVVRAALEDQHAQSGVRELPGQRAAARARAHDAGVVDVSGHVRPACADAALRVVSAVHRIGEKTFQRQRVQRAEERFLWQAARRDLPARELIEHPVLVGR